VPLLISWPGHIPAGQRCDRVASALDVNATILDALGCPALPHSEGRSVLPLIDGTGEQPAWDDVAYCEYCTDQFGPPEGAYQRMVRQDEWKLSYYHWQPPQLFNLKEDPDEVHDLGQDPGYAKIREELTAQVLNGWEPEAIIQRMEEKKADVKILQQWARNTGPEERYRWPLKPEMNWLATE